MKNIKRGRPKKGRLKTNEPLVQRSYRIPVATIQALEKCSRINNRPIISQIRYYLTSSLKEKGIIEDGYEG